MLILNNFKVVNETRDLSAIFKNSTVTNEQFKYLKTRHTWHLVDPSPWPLIVFLGAFFMAFGGVLYMHNFVGGEKLCATGFLVILYVMYIWWRNIIREATLEEQHTFFYIKKRLKWPTNLNKIIKTPILLCLISVVFGAIMNLFLIQNNVCYCEGDGREIALIHATLELKNNGMATSNIAITKVFDYYPYSVEGNIGNIMFERLPSKLPINQVVAHQAAESILNSLGAIQPDPTTVHIKDIFVSDEIVDGVVSKRLHTIFIDKSFQLNSIRWDVVPVVRTAVNLGIPELAYMNGNLPVESVCLQYVELFKQKLDLLHLCSPYYVKRGHLGFLYYMIDHPAITNYISQCGQSVIYPHNIYPYSIYYRNQLFDEVYKVILNQYIREAQIREVSQKWF